MPAMKDFEELMESTFSNEEYERIKAGAEFAAKLLKARLDRNLTQQQLAKKAGLKQSAIARIENNGVLPRIDTLIKIAKALNLEIDFVPIGYQLSKVQSPEQENKLDILLDYIKQLQNEVLELKDSISLQKRYQ